MKDFMTQLKKQNKRNKTKQKKQNIVGNPAGIPAGIPTQLSRKSAGIPAGNPPDWKNLAEKPPDSKELTASQFFQGSRHHRNAENATTLKRNPLF